MAARVPQEFALLFPSQLLTSSYWVSIVIQLLACILVYFSPLLIDGLYIGFVL